MVARSSNVAAPPDDWVQNPRDQNWLVVGLPAIRLMEERPNGAWGGLGMRVAVGILGIHFEASAVSWLVRRNIGPVGLVVVDRILMVHIVAVGEEGLPVKV